MKRSKAAAAVVLVLLLAGSWELGQGVYIHAKAVLAQVLLRDAWVRTLAGNIQVRPWPWADWWPVARLMVPSNDIDLVVLRGDSGSALAFGPGHLERSPQPGHTGNSVISGHRDTHFKFLRELNLEDSIRIQTTDGIVHDFKVVSADVVDANTARLVFDSDTAYLYLVTCYPFDAVLPGGSLRYVVIAKSVGSRPASHPALI